METDRCNTNEPDDTHNTYKNDLSTVEDAKDIAIEDFMCASCNGANEKDTAKTPQS